MDDEQSAEEVQATLDVLKAVWTIAHKYQVCTTCLMFNAATHVQTALAEGQIGHGAPTDEEAAEFGRQQSIRH
jgi:hypothetical protein